MSVNLHLSITVTGYAPTRGEAVKQAIQAIIERESLDTDLSPLAESIVNQVPVLSAHSDPDYPVIISSSYLWLPRVQTELSQAVEQANGGPCTVEFEGVDADESDDFEDEEEEDDEE